MYEDLVRSLREKAQFLELSQYGALGNRFTDTMNKAADAIEELSKSRKRGRWIRPVPGDGCPYCSECKGAAMTSGGMFPLYLYTLFCPSCGAEMENASVLLGRADNE